MLVRLVLLALPNEVQVVDDSDAGQLVHHFHKFAAVGAQQVTMLAKAHLVGYSDVSMSI